MGDTSARTSAAPSICHYRIPAAMHDTVIAAPEAELTRAAALHAAGSLQDAEQAFRNILESHPEHADTHHRLAIVLEQLNQRDTALQHFQAAVAAEPSQRRYWTACIDALARDGQTDMARELVAQARRHGIDALALELAQADVPSASAEDLTTVLAEFMSTLAVLLDKRQFAQAENIASQLTEWMPDVGLGWRALAVARIQQERHAEALVPLRKAASLMPDDADTQRDLAALEAHVTAILQAPQSAADAALPNAALCATLPGSRQFRHLAGGIVATIPILIPTFNNPTYTRRMVAQLQARGLRNIFIVDNASSAPDMLAFLDAAQDDATVVRLPHNAGPRDLFQSPANYARLPDIFCITDPDLALNEALPNEFLLELIDATEMFKVGKAGFALDISQPELMKQASVVCGDQRYTTIEWESRFWQHHVANTAAGDPIYNAPIDTTFAVYNKRYFRPEAHICGVRFAGRYTCKHLPWYQDTGLPEAEMQYYRDHQKWSNYLT
ncbi:TPA: tetratricopeptide repeat protein [Burkholderia vietnamiensis]|nr:tetratricopeptide repeat protein [Burkholderia vietnamiensis]